MTLVILERDANETIYLKVHVREYTGILPVTLEAKKGFVLCEKPDVQTLRLSQFSQKTAIDLTIYLTNLCF